MESPLQRVKMVSWKNEKRIISIELERKRYRDAPSGALSDEIAYMVTLSIYDDFLTPFLEATTPRP
ncbi:hypothetical protein [Massilia sp. CCM 8734]|uniref:hypothetical protein n=1 Tax=Massilia sp. CCM 8734 TaxID=2609283 RepID=UPI00141E8DB6|nr:hypothetical protein [Massilia sp. CCM 8734]NIA00506.1 hypothetical protein [Massilia sp. CCM 8734]